jgi:hypothetical protein
MPYADLATNFLKNEIQGKEIEIQRDFTDIDKYERKLRYVFYNNEFVNIEILQQGFATSFMLEGLNYKDKLKSAENFAKINNIGIWKKSSDKCSQCIVLVKLDSVKDYFILKNNCDFMCNLSGWFAKDDANHFFYFDKLDSLEEKEYNSKVKTWNKEGDRFYLRDSSGNLVIFYEYTGKK